VECNVCVCVSAVMSDVDYTRVLMDNKTQITAGVYERIHFTDY